MRDELTDAFDRARAAHAEKENTILKGQISGSVAGQQERVTGVSRELAQQTETRKHKDNNHAQFMHLVESVRVSAERLAADVAAMENQFRKRDGDAWREKLALKILGEDDIPQRRDGESMGDYRERLEPYLVNELLNEDGTIKGEYKNHPELGDYAQWAQKQYHLNSARTYIAELEDPGTTLDRQYEIFEELEQRANMEEQTFADRQAKPQSEIQGHIKDGTDSTIDNKFDVKLSDNKLSDFLKPIG